MLRSVVWTLQQWIQILEPEVNFMKEVSVRLNSDLPVILDGAMGTQLLDRGFDLTPPLWSAEILELSGKTIEEIHKDYINVGAEIITTNTFRTTTRTFRKVFQHSIEKATENAWNSCKIAVKAARKAAGRDIFVAGSIGPLEDCYIPELFPGEKAGLYEYNEIGKWLEEAGVDFFLIETMGRFDEARCALRALDKSRLDKWVSFLIKDANTIFDGTNLRKGSIAIESEGASAILINCSKLDDAVKAMELIANTVSIPVGVYPNLGKSSPWAKSTIKRLFSEEEFIQWMKRAVSSGAKIIGGCCGSSPKYIEALKNSLK